MLSPYQQQLGISSTLPLFSPLDAEFSIRVTE
jgi:hypothetical protein